MSGTLKRRETMARILAARGNALVVTGLGSTTYDAFATHDSPLTFYLWGAMGAAAMIGLGLANAQPQRRVLVVTGDGEMLMGLGSLATIGAARTANLSIVVIDNEHYAETGMQRSHTARGSTWRVSRTPRLRMHRPYAPRPRSRRRCRCCYTPPGPVFAVIKVVAELAAIALPPRDEPYLRSRFRAALLGEVTQSTEGQARRGHSCLAPVFTPFPVRLRLPSAATYCRGETQMKQLILALAATPPEGRARNPGRWDPPARSRDHDLTASRTSEGDAPSPTPKDCAPARPSREREACVRGRARGHSEGQRRGCARRTRDRGALPVPGPAVTRTTLGRPDCASRRALSSSASSRRGRRSARSRAPGSARDGSGSGPDPAARTRARERLRP